MPLEETFSTMTRFESSDDIGIRLMDSTSTQEILSAAYPYFIELFTTSQTDRDNAASVSNRTQGIKTDDDETL